MEKVEEIRQQLELALLQTKSEVTELNNALSEKRMQFIELRSILSEKEITEPEGDETLEEWQDVVHEMRMNVIMMCNSIKDLKKGINGKEMTQILLMKELAELQNLDTPKVNEPVPEPEAVPEPEEIIHDEKKLEFLACLGLMPVKRARYGP